MKDNAAWINFFLFAKVLQLVSFLKSSDSPVIVLLPNFLKMDKYLIQRSYLIPLQFCISSSCVYIHIRIFCSLLLILSVHSAL